ncbi:MAG: GNAT family N-acetyltransferase [Candidatus Tectimicrobiota bacterium]
MLQPITVRDADLWHSGQQEAIVSLLNAYASDPMGGGQALTDEVRAALIPGLQQLSSSRVFLAWEGDVAVGIAVCFLGFSTFAARPLLNIHDLAVLASHRRRGVGRLLLEHVAQAARALGCCKLTLEVREDNTPAQRLYHEVGFDTTAAYGGAVRVWFLEKRLRG